MHSRYRPALLAALYLLAFSAPVALVGARAAAQTVPVSGGSASLISKKWHLTPLSVRYGAGATRGQVQVILNLKNRSGLPLPLVGTGLRFALAGKTSYALSSIDMNRLPMLANNAQTPITLTFMVPPEDQGSVKYLRVADPDPRVVQDPFTNASTIYLPPRP